MVLHDLALVEEGTFVNGLLVFLPPLCWIAAVLWPRPFLTVVVTGAIYAVFLAAGSSLVTGTIVGVITGAVAATLCRVVPDRRS